MLPKSDLTSSREFIDNKLCPSTYLFLRDFGIFDFFFLGYVVFHVIKQNWTVSIFNLYGFRYFTISRSFYKFLNQTIL